MTWNLLTVSFGNNKYRRGQSFLNKLSKQLGVNHFAVDEESLPKNIKVTHKHLNDNTVAGIACKEVSAYSVQYHPEASPGPHDSRYVFKEFFKMMEQNAKAN